MMITYKEIKTQYVIDHCVGCDQFLPGCSKQNCQHKMILTAIEKQIPAKVIRVEDPWTSGVICPMCKHNLTNMEVDLQIERCDCGQLLDWEN